MNVFENTYSTIKVSSISWRLGKSSHHMATWISTWKYLRKSSELCAIFGKAPHHMINDTKQIVDDVARFAWEIKRYELHHLLWTRASILATYHSGTFLESYNGCSESSRFCQDKSFLAHQHKFTSNRNFIEIFSLRITDVLRTWLLILNLMIFYYFHCF